MSPLILVQFQSFAQYSLEGFDLEGDVYAWHDTALGVEKTGLVVGSYQQVKRSSVDSHPFFKNDSWQPNRIRYNEEEFSNVYLMYDLEEQILVFRHPTELKFHSQPIKPILNQVDWFTLEGHLFKYYDEDILNINPGFFDQLYIGDQFDLIVKRIKNSRAEQRGIIYVSSDIYVVRFQNEYHRLRRKGSLLRLFEKEHRKEVRQFIKKNGLMIKPENEWDLKEVAHFCDELLKRSKQ